MVNTDRNRRGTEPYARWCERTGVVKLPPTRLSVINFAKHGRHRELTCRVKSHNRLQEQVKVALICRSLIGKTTS